jgi:DNA invertase Pin-like site-specific DNA recombinase
MSSPKGASQRSCEAGAAISGVSSKRGAAGEPRCRNDTMRAFAGTPSSAGISAQPRRPRPTEDEEIADPDTASASLRHPRSAGPASDYARSRHAWRALRAAVVGYAAADAKRPDHGCLELRRQEEEIASVCKRRGLRLLEVVRDRESTRQRAFERPGLGYALERIAAGQASGLVVSELSRLSHSLPELGRVLDWLARHDARFVAVVPGLDTDEEAGRLVVRTIVEVSRWERQRLVERTRIGLRAARRKGPGSVADYPELRERIATMRADGKTLQAIADQLNAEAIPTIRGGVKWRPSSVQAAAGYRRPAVGRNIDQWTAQANRHHAEAEDE